MPLDFDFGIRVRDMVVRPFQSPPPVPSALLPALNRVARRDAVEGYLVGVTDGSDWGWWGPVNADIAAAACRMFQRVASNRPGTPEQWARRLRAGTRHAHTGVLAVSVGAAELACWDLLGQRYRVPVWRLSVRREVRATVPAYATCFGLRLDDQAAPALVAEVRQRWPVQKWRPVRRLLVRGSAARAASAAAGPGGLALDFGGRWTARRACSLAVSLPERAAFLEEPVAPGCWTQTAVRGWPAPLAAGEHVYGPDDTAALEAAGVDIWQPDAVFCGGPESFAAIAFVARSAGRRVYAHGGGLVPAVHAAVSGVPVDAVEVHLMLEPRRQAHLTAPVMPDGSGSLPVPTAPGWGGSLRADL
jgi:D-galactarolactone cycloisomerase